ALQGRVETRSSLGIERLRWRSGPLTPTLSLRSCVARQEPYIPGALSILKGTVPGRVRGSGHMVPTYFRRELRDRVLQRRLWLRAFVLLPRYFQASFVIPRRKPGIHDAAASWFYRRFSGTLD